MMHVFLFNLLIAIFQINNISDYDVAIYRYYAIDKEGEKIGGYPVVYAFIDNKWLFMPCEKPANWDMYSQTKHNEEDELCIYPEYKGEYKETLNFFKNPSNTKKVMERYKELKTSMDKNIHLSNHDLFFQVRYYQKKKLIMSFIFRGADIAPKNDIYRKVAILRKAMSWK